MNQIWQTKTHKDKDSHTKKMYTHPRICTAVSRYDKKNLFVRWLRKNEPWKDERRQRKANFWMNAMDQSLLIILSEHKYATVYSRLSDFFAQPNLTWGRSCLGNSEFTLLDPPRKYLAGATRLVVRNDWTMGGDTPTWLADRGNEHALYVLDIPRRYLYKRDEGSPLASTTCIRW